MKNSKMINVWNTSEVILATLKPGVRVYAGDKSNRGIWCGIKKSGTQVVAWEGNIKGRKDKVSYVKRLMEYAKT